MEGRQAKASSMLLGQHGASIDAKGRVALPKRFREILGNNIIVTLGYENSLVIVSEENWKPLLEGTEGKPFIHYETRETQRFLLGGASFAELDDKGRFIVPSYLRSFAKIENEVVFLGLSRYVELWSRSIWEAYQKNLEKNIQTISQRLVEEEVGKKT